MLRVVLAFYLTVISGISVAADTITTDQWQFAVAVGYGYLDNPRAKAKPIETYVLPSWRYYGENAYVDNFTLGYSVVENDSFYLDVQSKLNEDGMFFELDGISNLFATDLFGIKDQRLPVSRPGKEVQPVVYSNIKRKVSYLGGVVAGWYSPFGELSFGAFNDISSVHNGSELQLRYKLTGDLFRIRWGLELGATHKNLELIKYYYQVTDAERQRIIYTYQPKATINSHIRLVANKALATNWSLVAIIEYNHLGAGISNSPMMGQSSYISGFAGISYTF